MLAFSSARTTSFVNLAYTSALSLRELTFMLCHLVHELTGRHSPGCVCHAYLRERFRDCVSNTCEPSISKEALQQHAEECSAEGSSVQTHVRAIAEGVWQEVWSGLRMTAFDVYRT